MSNANTQQQPIQTLLKCFVVDDEQAAISKLETFISATTGLKLIGSEIDPLKAQEILSGEKPLPDILFLDIEMKGTYGLKLAQIVMNKTQVVFITGHAQFAVDAFRLDATDYLLKPISYPHFLEAVAKCRIKIEHTDKSKKNLDLLFIKDSLSGKLVKVSQDEIYCIQSNGNYCKVNCMGKTSIMPHMSLRQLLSKLRGDLFLRIHKSYAVNLKYIFFYDGNGTVQLTNEMEIEVGRTFKKKLKAKIKAAHSR